MRTFKSALAVALAAVIYSPLVCTAIVYDAASGFSATSNPAGVWSYGYSTALGSPMVLHPERASDNLIDIWRTNIWLEEPAVFHNGTSSTITNSTGTFVIPAGGLSLHPGPGGQYSLLRFSAPAAGAYQLSAAFSGWDIAGTTTDVHVLTNGISIFDGVVNGYGAGSGPSYSSTVNLNAGDSIDFAVGWGADQDFGWDSTGLSAQITSGSLPPTCVTPPPGLISWWPANGSTADVIGTNHGAAFGSLTYSNGKVAQAFSFNGSSYVKVPNSPSLNPAGSFSIETWVYPRQDPTAWANLFGKWGDSGEFYNQRSYAMGLLPGRVANFSITDAAHQGDLPFHTFNTPTNVITLQAWNHLVAVYDQSAGARRIYVNGVKVAERIDAPITVLNGTAPLAFGARMRSATYLDSYFSGLLDEVSLYNRALTDAEIQALYLADGSGKCSDLIPPTITTQPASQLAIVGSSVTFNVVASGTQPLSYQWQFNGASLAGKTTNSLTLASVQLADAGTYRVVVTNLAGSVTSSNAVLTVNPPACVPPPSGMVSWWRGENDATDGWDSNNGTNTPSFVGGKVGRAFASYVVVPDAASLRLTNGMTVEAWVYPTSLSGSSYTLVSKFDFPFSQPTNRSSFCLGLTNNGRLYFAVSPGGSARTNNTTLRTAQALPINQWTYVVATYDGAALNLYLNGALAAQTNYSAGIFPGTASLGIGVIPPSPAYPYSTWPFSGYLDEVSLYNRALSLDEIQAIYGAGSAGKCLAPPIIVAQPQSQAIPRGEEALFAVSALGSKPRAYQWRFNGQALFRATNDTLYLENVQSNQIGTYSVLVSNTVGAVLSSNAQLTLLPPPSCVETLPGIISWWPGDGSPVDAVGTNDVLIYPLHPYPYPSIYTTGKVGQAFNTACSVPNSPTLNFGSNADFSIEAWIKVPPATSYLPLPPPIGEPITTIVEKGFDISSVTGYAFELYGGRLACLLGVGPFGPVATNTTFISPGPDLRDDRFHHVALTLDRDATNGGNLYVDGQSVLTFDPTRLRGSLENTAPLTLGMSGIRIVFPETSAGLIDEPAIYNRALSAAEILAIRQAGSAGKCKVPPWLVAEPAARMVTETSNTTFTVMASGMGLRYQWRFNGTNLAGATRAELTLTNVQWAQRGLYAVRVTNAFGSALSTNALLTVNRLPVVRCKDVILAADADCMNSASVNDGSFDPDADPITLSQFPAGPYPLGTNQVTLLVADNRGASNSGIAQVIVLDQTPPVVACPANIISTNDLDQCGAIVTFPWPTATDLCSAITNLTCAPGPGSFFLAGTTTVQCSATDAAGNVGQSSFTVVVRDTQAPALTCPADIVVTNAHDQWTSVVTYVPSVSDNCPGVGLPICDPASGSVFSLGTHTVTCSVLDAAGNSNRCSFTVSVSPGNLAPVPVIEVFPLAHFPGRTNLLVIVPDNTNATVVFDGSKSYDLDDTNFYYFWAEGTNLFSTNAVATHLLPVGRHEITLLLDDTFPLGTNSASVTVDLVAPCAGVGIVQQMVQGSDLPPKAQRPLLATLEAACASFERNNFTAGANQLRAFQNQVRALVAPSAPALADALVQAAQQIIDAVDPNPSAGHLNVKFQSLAHQHGKMGFKFLGAAGKVHLVQASTNLVDWQTIGVATSRGDGAFEFEDAKATTFPNRFYRIVAP